jgi:hypothetical protein
VLCNIFIFMFCMNKVCLECFELDTCLLNILAMIAS